MSSIMIALKININTLTVQDYYSLKLMVLMYEIKTKDVYEDFSMDTKMFDFSNYSAKSKYYHGSNRLVFHKIKDKTATVASEKFGRLKQKMTFF